MQHIVIALFDTYTQAESAREALIAAGITPNDIALQTRCEPTYANDATSVAATRNPENEGLLANIERFFETLFASEPLPTQETTQYAEAMRRGAIMVSVDAATDTIAKLAHATLEHMDAINIDERAATWHAPSNEAIRAHSSLEELGIRQPTPSPYGKTVRSYTRRETSSNATSTSSHPAAVDPPVTKNGQPKK